MAGGVLGVLVLEALKPPRELSACGKLLDGTGAPAERLSHGSHGLVDGRGAWHRSEHPRFVSSVSTGGWHVSTMR
jgi:hypothetical protein